jgi:hypothetical protein
MTTLAPTKLQAQISKCINTEDLERVLDAHKIETLQDNGFATSFNRKLGDALWYDFKSFEDCKQWCINVCIGYNK